MESITCKLSEWVYGRCKLKHTHKEYSVNLLFSDSTTKIFRDFFDIFKSFNVEILSSTIL